MSNICDLLSPGEQPKCRLPQLPMTNGALCDMICEQAVHGW